MISIGSATRVYLAPGSTDMRKGFEGLSGLVREKLQGDPLSGHLFLFCNAQRTRLKILFWDGSGLWVCAKRLERGRFSWPTVSQQEGVGQSCRIALRAEELALLLGGLEMDRVQRKNWWRTEVAL